MRDILVTGESGPRTMVSEELRERLKAEGLFDRERKRQLPSAPACLGIITSATSRVLHDIMHILQRRAPGLPTQFVAAATTGRRASAEITAALRQISSSGVCDLIILARGGGSQDELAPYNSEQVVRAIAECAVPVISAVGHEPDVTMADLAADLRCATPSVAAEHVAVLHRQRLTGSTEGTQDNTLVRIYAAGLRITVQRDLSSE